MITINARNVNDAYRQGMTLLNTRTMRTDPLPSRNGPVMQLRHPVTTVYARPTERVLFDERRDANPFFHLFEALWMLTGADDLETLTRFISSFAQFSDDGEHLHGAYGFRWRHAGEDSSVGYDGIDQLAGAIGMLTENPYSRRVVIQMWDVNKDFGVDSKDIPCNDMIDLQIINGHLHMIVFCRSNDIVFGAYGANAVHMSVLHEYLASMIGVPVGPYSQISCNFHAYTESPYVFSSFFPLEEHAGDPYDGGYRVFPLCTVPVSFDFELDWFMYRVRAWMNISMADVAAFKNPFFLQVAWPMYCAFRYYKNKQPHEALFALQNPSRIDWLGAAQMWITRRIARRAAP